MKAFPQELLPEWYVIAAVIFGALVVYGIVHHLLLKLRETAIRKSGDQLGLAIYRNEKELREQEGWDVTEITRRNALFTNCWHQEITNILYAENDGLSVFVFDQKYDELKSVANNRKLGIRQTVVAIVSQEIDVQKFELSVSGMVEHGFYEDFAKGIFEFLEKHPKTTVEGHRQTILIYEPGRRFRPSDYSDLVGRGFEVFQILKTKDDSPEKRLANNQPLTVH